MYPLFRSFYRFFLFQTALSFSLSRSSPISTLIFSFLTLSKTSWSAENVWHLHHKWFIISFAHWEERKTMKYHSERCSTVIKFSKWVSWHNYTTSNCTHATIKVKDFAIFRMVGAAKLKKMLRAITKSDLIVRFL